MLSIAFMFEIAPHELKDAIEFIFEGKYKYAPQLLSDFEERKILLYP